MEFSQHSESRRNVCKSISRSIPWHRVDVVRYEMCHGRISFVMWCNQVVNLCVVRENRWPHDRYDSRERMQDQVLLWRHQQIKLTRCESCIILRSWRNITSTISVILSSLGKDWDDLKWSSKLTFQMACHLMVILTFLFWQLFNPFYTENSSSDQNPDKYKWTRIYTSVLQI